VLALWKEAQAIEVRVARGTGCRHAVHALHLKGWTLSTHAIHATVMGVKDNPPQPLIASLLIGRAIDNGIEVLEQAEGKL
jgi:hypothetical protein